MNNKQPIYWEHTENGHNKFWAANIIEKIVKRDGNSIKVYCLVRKWGKIETNGQTMEQEFNERYEAEEALKRLIWEKENKGYKPIF